jgi:two-component system, cell cycle sensor histidine kinase and response regulator CckA
MTEPAAMSVAIYNPFDEPEKMRAIEAVVMAIVDNIGSPLMAAQAAADRLFETSKLATDAQEDGLLIKRSMKDAATVIKYLLSIVSQRTVQPEISDIRAMLVALKPLLSSIIDKSVTLEISYTPDLWPIRADSQSFETIILALSVNACEAMSNGGTLRWHARNITSTECYTLYELALPAADYVAIEAIDSGSGIRADLISRIFEPFFSTKPGRGNGTGLTEVYRAIKQMNAHILIESEVGKGTTVRIFVPPVVPTR